LRVRSGTDPNEDLGSVRGFIVDASSGRLHYVVIDSGGWFSGGSYLIPPAYTRVDAEQEVLWADLTRDVLRRFPEFDPGKFPELSEDQLWAIEQRIIEAYGDDPGVIAPAARWPRQDWPQYDQPGWWKNEYVPAISADRERPAVAERRERHEVGVAGARGSYSDPVGSRARPGDVLGIERAGETTSLGDTAADEDQRRQSAEKEWRDRPADNERE
jgi:hypothetical protein